MESTIIACVIVFFLLFLFLCGGIGWSNHRTHKQCKQPFRQEIIYSGLDEGKWMTINSDWDGTTYPDGSDQNTVKECSDWNLNCYYKDESSGLSDAASYCWRSNGQTKSLMKCQHNPFCKKKRSNIETIIDSKKDGDPRYPIKFVKCTYCSLQAGMDACENINMTVATGQDITNAYSCGYSKFAYGRISNGRDCCSSTMEYRYF